MSLSLMRQSARNLQVWPGPCTGLGTQTSTIRPTLFNVREAVLQLAVAASVCTGHMKSALLQSVCPGAGVPARASLHIRSKLYPDGLAPSRAS